MQVLQYVISVSCNTMVYTLSHSCEHKNTKNISLKNAKTSLVINTLFDNVQNLKIREFIKSQKKKI